MGNKNSRKGINRANYDAVPTRELTSNQSARSERKSQDVANVYNKPFYQRKIFEHNGVYFEQQMYDQLAGLWRNAIANYDTATGDIQRAINANMHELIDLYNFHMIRRYTSVPTDLLTYRHRYVYKLARIRKNDGRIMDTVAALVTMKIDMDRCKIADSYTGRIQQIDSLLKNKEYCCNQAEVYSLKLIGDMEDVIVVTPKVLTGVYSICSNFDLEFKYTVGHVITEPNFPVKGTACYQGIHFFTNEDAAIKYVDKGMVNKIMALPYLTKVLMIEESDDRKVEGVIHGWDGNETVATHQLDETTEAILKYYTGIPSESYNGLKKVCKTMFGSWYMENNFVDPPTHTQRTEIDVGVDGLRRRHASVH